MSLFDAKCVHFIGIGGVGMSAIARALLAQGVKVQGSDRVESTITRALANEGAHVMYGHAASNLDGADVVVITSALLADNVELVAAKERGLKVVHRSLALETFINARRKAIGVAGTHGKGTTSAMLTRILEEAGKNPSFLIGAMLYDFDSLNARWVDSDDVVAEVDESDGSLVNIKPTVTVLTNLETDHLSYYRDLAHIQETVLTSLNNNERLEMLIARADCPGSRTIIEQFDQKRVITFSPSELVPADVQCRNLKTHVHGASFEVHSRFAEPFTVHMNVPGEYNTYNALAAIAWALFAEVPVEVIQRALSAFKGLHNRFYSRSAGPHRVITDYVSHPTAIAHVLATAAHDPRKLVAIFRPWRYTLLGHYFEDFVQAFQAANCLILTDVDSGGEPSMVDYNSDTLADRIRAPHREVVRVAGVSDVTAYLMQTDHPPSQFVYLGGNDLFHQADLFIDFLKKKSST